MLVKEIEKLKMKYQTELECNACLWSEKSKFNEISNGRLWMTITWPY